MIGNPLLLTMLNGAANVAGEMLGNNNAAAGILNGGESINNGNDFLSLLNQASESDIAPEVSDILNYQNTEEEVSQFLSEQLSIESETQIPDAETTISQILGGKKQASDADTQTGNNLNSEVTNANINQNADQITANTKAENNNAVAAQQSNIANNNSNNNLNTQEEIIKVEDKYINPLSKNLGLKEDERLLGKDNLQSIVKGTNQDINFKNNEVLGLTNEIIGGQVKSNSNPNGKESVVDLKLSDASADIQNSNNNIVHKNDADQFAKQDNFAKIAQNSRNIPQQTAQQQNEGNYKIVNFTKTPDGIELNLEPTSLGKVRLKFEFNTDGKSTIAIIAEKAETLETLKSDSSAIKEILEENGLKSDSNSLSFNLQQQGQQGQEQKQKFDFGNTRTLSFNIEQELNGNEHNISASNTSHLYKDLTGVGMLDMVV